MRVSFFISLLLVFFTASAAPLKPDRAAIASAHPLATQAGIDIIKQGGNAFDAAIAVTAALAVVEPYSSGLGGGGFWLLHQASSLKTTMLDGREKAPLAAHRDMYLDKSGNVIDGLSINGPLAAGIPGVPAALVHLAKHYGLLPLSTTLAPAIQLATEGFAVDKRYQSMARFRLQSLLQSPASSRVFLHQNKVPTLGTLIKQPDLALTLKAISTEGHAGFYQGTIAKLLVQGVRKSQGIWSLKDLEQYQVIEREPIIGEFQGITVTSAPPPSSGGIALVTMLNILSAYELKALPSPQKKHTIIEAMRRAYRDRAQFLGDSDFVPVPVEQLTSPHYAAGLRASINPSRATPSNSLPGEVEQHLGTDTTHFSILDNAGNRVSATLSINFPFGSGFMPPGTGVLLNDEMDDFSAKPGTPNVYGLVGNEANAIAPGKRPLSSMSPTFLEDDKRVAILGTPGGSRIITMVLLAILDFAKGNPPESWVKLGRFHHQFLPDHVQYEVGALSKTEISHLERLGHSLKARAQPYGNMHAILWDKKHKKVSAASDPRGLGSYQLH